MKVTVFLKHPTPDGMMEVTDWVDEIREDSAAYVGKFVNLCKLKEKAVSHLTFSYEPYPWAEVDHIEVRKD